VGGGQPYRNSGDGLQINAGAGQGATTHHSSSGEMSPTTKQLACG
jgi:hypothetical protein